MPGRNDVASAEGEVGEADMAIPHLSAVTARATHAGVELMIAG